MKDGIVIEYDGKRYEFNNCIEGKSCFISENCDKCRKNNPIIHSLCVQTVAMSDMYCTSYTPIVEEAKAYSALNHSEAEHLVHKRVEFSDNGKSWFESHLSEIDDSPSHFKAEKDGTYYEYIREIPKRHLTWTELQAKYPDELGDVELVEEVKSDE